MSPSAVDPSIYRVRGAAALLAKNADWIEATEEIRKVIPGTNPADRDAKRETVKRNRL